ncbi:MFS-1-like domain-containing protein [Aphelenchoides fujianensis]|nr:MFS-1-like domain-containing protein [Aphelenchoides fujianensis]
MPSVQLSKTRVAYNKKHERAPLLLEMDSSGSSADERERGNTADAIDPSASSPDHVLNKFDPWNPYILAVFVASASMVSAFSVADVCASNDKNCVPNNNTINAEVGDWLLPGGADRLPAPVLALSLLVACSFPAVIFGVNNGMESELNTWLRRANAFGTKVDVNVKGLIAAHQRKGEDGRNEGPKHRPPSRPQSSPFDSDLAGNKYLNYVLLGLIEAPSNFASPYFLNVFGRRMFIKHPTGALVLWLVGKFGIICSFNCLYVYCSELYPTNVRSGCTGACEAVGRIGLDKTIYVELPTIIFTALAAASGGLTLLLPETKDAVLPDTAADILPCVASAVAFFFYLPESFRFMVMHERTNDLDRFLQRVKRAEPTDAGGNNLDARLLIAQYKRISEPAMQSRLFTELAADRMLIAFVYYGLSLFSSELAGNKYVNYLLLGLVEAPANIGSPYLLKLLGRKLFITSMHFAADRRLCRFDLTTHPTLSLIVWLVGKSATVCAFNALFVSASEIFPTTIRSGCIGICEITARIGAAFAPVFHSFESGDPQTMKIIYAAAGFVGSCATLVIPETSKTPLPDTAKKQTPRDIVE